MLSILADHVRVDRLCNRRPVHMAEPLLAQLQRRSEAAHHCGVGVAESMEPIALRNLDPELVDQRLELPL